MAAKFLHLIDGDGSIAPPVEIARYVAATLNADPKTLPKPAANADDQRVPSIPALKERGCDYRVVGVFGGQSSGKSTLLNHLFDTDFQMMDETRGRGQTTRGCFLSKARCAEAAATKSGEGLFVMDFEGTDGIERGEDQNFEKQLSLFALSVADTLVINMWTNEVGRFNAANLSLLQTVFEVDLQLMAHEARGGAGAPSSAAKPTLLFVLRDNVDTPLETLAPVIQKSLKSIWESMNRPAAFAKSSVEDFFHLRFASLPHFKLQKQEFRAAVDDLRKWFLDAGHEQYLYRHIQSGNFRDVPLDGLSPYLASCWAQIKTNKDLDIPSQRQMLARLRCDELAEQLVKDLDEEAAELIAGINEGRLRKNISAWATDAAASRLSLFEDETEHYCPSIVTKKRDELAEQLSTAAGAVVTAQCGKVAEKLLRTSDDKVQSVMDSALLSALPRLAREWYGKLTTARTEALQKAKEQGLPAEDAMLAAKKAQEAVKADRAVAKFWAFIDAEVKAVTQKLRQQLERLVAESASAKQEDEEASNDDPAAAAMRGVLVCLEGDDESTERTLQLLGDAIQDRVSTRLETITTDASGAMLKVFERMLATNEDGSTRFLTTITGLDREFGPARAGGLLLLACVAVNRLESSSGGSVDPTSESDVRARTIAKAVALWQRDAVMVNFAASDNARSILGAPKVAAMPSVSADDEVKLAALNAFETLVQMDAATVARSYEMFDMKTDFAYQQERTRIAAGTQNVPGYMYLLIAVLGFNEMWYIITNPLLLVLIALFGYVFARNFVVAQWEKFEESGPASVVVPMQTAVAFVGAQWRQHVAPLLEGPPRAAEVGRKKVQ